MTATCAHGGTGRLQPRSRRQYLGLAVVLGYRPECRIIRPEHGLRLCPGDGRGALYTRSPISQPCGQCHSQRRVSPLGAAAIGGANKASWSTRPAGPGPIKTTPSVICAEDTGRCLTVWADDNYNSCTTVTYNDLYCHSEKDGPGSHSEFYIEVGGSKIWGVSSTATGERETINLTRSFCTSETYDLWEEDDWPNGDDGFGSATFYALSPGSGSYRHTGADATVSWYVHPKYIPTVYGRLFEPSGTPVACNSAGPIAISHEVTHLKHTPVAASDGTNFLVAWEMNNVLWLNRLSNTCARETTYQLSAASHASSNPALVCG